MTFATLTFLLFLPTVFGLYWAFEDRVARNSVVVVVVSYVWWDYRFCALMLATSCSISSWPWP